MMVELITHCFDLLDIASIHQHSCKGPTELTCTATQEKGNSRDCVGENVGCEAFEDNGLKHSLLDISGLNELKKHGLTCVSCLAFETYNYIFLEEGHDGIEEISKHKLINIVIKLIGEKLIKSKPLYTLLAIHPRHRPFGFITKTRSNLSPHPLKCIIMLHHVSIESPYSINSIHMINALW
jgi:hypothetical protein